MCCLKQHTYLYVWGLWSFVHVLSQLLRWHKITSPIQTASGLVGSRSATKRCLLRWGSHSHRVICLTTPKHLKAVFFFLVHNRFLHMSALNIPRWGGGATSGTYESFSLFSVAPMNLGAQLGLTSITHTNETLTYRRQQIKKGRVFTS